MGITYAQAAFVILTTASSGHTEGFIGNKISMRFPAGQLASRYTKVGYLQEDASRVGREDPDKLVSEPKGSRSRLPDRRC
ncbi:hypothetical protein MN608_05120 [Microdochium nivale]|nr:hypothetical protein MN608_05120 [Microdochium nivale]